MICFLVLVCMGVRESDSKLDRIKNKVNDTFLVYLRDEFVLLNTNNKSPCDFVTKTLFHMDRWLAFVVNIFVCLFVDYSESMLSFASIFFVAWKLDWTESLDNDDDSIRSDSLCVVITALAVAMMVDDMQMWRVLNISGVCFHFLFVHSIINVFVCLLVHFVISR